MHIKIFLTKERGEKLRNHANLYLLLNKGIDK